MITSQSDTKTTKTTKATVSPDFEKFRSLAKKLVSVSKADLKNQEREKKLPKRQIA